MDARQVFQLIEEVSKYSSHSVDLAVRSATTHFSYTVNQIEENEEESSTVDSDLLPRLTFIYCQLENVLVPKTRRKYNMVTTILSHKCELISPAAYSYLQSPDCISLPHHSTLLRLSENIGLENILFRNLNSQLWDLMSNSVMFPFIWMKSI